MRKNERQIRHVDVRSGIQIRNYVCNLNNVKQIV